MVTFFAFSNFGKGGNSSSGNPRILKKLCPLRIEAAFLPSTSIETSLEGSSRMMVNSRRAGSVVAPSFSTLASNAPRTPTSRSVVVRWTSPPLAWSKTLERIGRVVRVLTTFWTCCKPSSSFSFVALNFMSERKLSCKAYGFIRQPQAPSASACPRESTLQSAVDERDRLANVVLFQHPSLHQFAGVQDGAVIAP